MELHSLLNDDIPGIDSDGDYGTAERSEYDHFSRHDVLYTKKRFVRNITRSRNQELQKITPADHESSGIAMLLPPGATPEPETHTPRRFSRLAKRSTRANDDDFIMPAPACIGPT